MSVIYIMRHGVAGPAASGLPDSSRTLTPQGFQQMKDIARRLADRAPDIEKIICSPYVRARQTAALVNNELGVDLEVNEHITPNGNVDQVIDLIAGIEDEVLIVSHMPLVGEVARTLTHKGVPFHQGTCIAVKRQDVYSSSGELLWVQNP